MQIFRDTHFDFMKWKNHLVIVSTLLNVFGISIFLLHYAGGSLNVGIDFKGGTEIQVKFAKAISVGDVRTALDNAELKGASVTTIGDPAENEIYIRLPLQKVESQVLLKGVTNALRGLSAQAPTPAGGIDLNVADEKTITDFLVDAGKFGREEASGTSWLVGRASLSDFSIRSQNTVEGAISKELAVKAFYAVLGSMLVMLIYIWIRFRFQWGVGAIVALIHDVIVTLGIFCLTGKEWTLPVIAAFLTLTGYSVNDTIVVFDRIRENLNKKKPGTLQQVINDSINQTLSRTIITSFLTWLVVVALFVFGGEVINGFAFVLLIGIVVGTYSSIYIASPIILFWEKLFPGKAAAAGAAGGSGTSKGRA